MTTIKVERPDGVATKILRAIHLIDSGVDLAPGLTPVTKGLPEHCVTVISYNGVCFQLDFYDMGFECWSSELCEVPFKVTHWMALPEVPKEE